jgi:hypothetical protein
VSQVEQSNIIKKENRDYWKKDEKNNTRFFNNTAAKHVCQSTRRLWV